MIFCLLRFANDLQKQELHLVLQHVEVVVKHETDLEATAQPGK